MYVFLILSFMQSIKLMIYDKKKALCDRYDWVDSRMLWALVNNYAA